MGNLTHDTRTICNSNASRIGRHPSGIGRGDDVATQQESKPTMKAKKPYLVGVTINHGGYEYRDTSIVWAHSSEEAEMICRNQMCPTDETGMDTDRTWFGHHPDTATEFNSVQRISPSFARKLDDMRISISFNSPN